MVEHEHSEFRLPTEVLAENVTQFLKDILNRESHTLSSQEETTLAYMMHAGTEAQMRLEMSDPQDDAVELATVVNEGSRAKELLIMSVSQTVARLAYKYKKVAQRLDVDDLIQEANLDLWRKADKFDPQKARFSTFANYWINRAMLRALTDKDRLIRIQTQVQEAINRIRKTQRQHGLTDDQTGELAALLNEAKNDENEEKNGDEKKIITEADIKHLLGFDLQVWSYNAVFNGEQWLNFFIDETDVSEEAIEAVRDEAIAKELQRLSERSRRIIELGFGFDDGVVRNNVEIAKEIGGIGSERVRQLQKEALVHLRTNAAYLKDFY